MENMIRLDTDKEIEQLRKPVIELKKLLSNEGEYSIHRTDGKPMELWEVITIGNVLEKIDKVLKEDGNEANRS